MRSGSRAELAEVVIGVKIGQAIPFAFRHCAEVGMELPNKVPRLLRETLDKPAQFLQVGSEFDRACATSLLVHFRSGLEPMRPREWRPEREPFRENARERGRCWLRRPHTHVEPEAIA